jgi:hypothetical protein
MEASSWLHAPAALSLGYKFLVIDMGLGNHQNLCGRSGKSCRIKFGNLGKGEISLLEADTKQRLLETGVWAVVSA